MASFVRGYLWFYVVRHLLRINDLRAKLHFSCKKVFRGFGGYVVKQYFCTRFRERNADEYWNTETKLRSRTSTEKTFFENFFRKVLAVQKKSLPLHPLSKTIAIKKSSLKDLDMNKQVVQDCSIKNYKLIIKNWELQKPSITYKQVKDRFGSWADYTTRKS